MGAATCETPAAQTEISIASEPKPNSSVPIAEQASKTNSAARAERPDSVPNAAAVPSLEAPEVGSAQHEGWNESKGRQ